MAGRACLFALALWPAASGLRQDGTEVDAAGWKRRGTIEGPRQCIANGDPHVWVEHKEACLKRRSFSPDDEPLGCSIIDFQREETMKHGTEVHWQGANYGQRRFIYNHGMEGSCSEPYHMPDYCSRAIVSELSTVYDGKLRVASLLAGTKVMFHTKEEQCDTAMGSRSPDETYESVLRNKTKWRACWGFAQDWRKMWCSKYARCWCTPGKDGDCLHDDKVQCCRDMYQLFLDGVRPGQFTTAPVAGVPGGKPVTMATARTRAILRVELAAPSGATTLGWLRLAYRGEAKEGLPSVFAEYAGHRTFVDPAHTLDLCAGHQVVDAQGAGFAIQGAQGRYGFRLEPGGAAGPGLQQEAPQGGAEVSDLVAGLVSEFCRA